MFFSVWNIGVSKALRTLTRGNPLNIIQLSISQVYMITNNFLKELPDKIL